jgi:ferric-dicitrate binding protein FerR (iron transport regulator)
MTAYSEKEYEKIGRLLRDQMGSPPEIEFAGIQICLPDRRRQRKISKRLKRLIWVISPVAVALIVCFYLWWPKAPQLWIGSQGQIDDQTTWLEAGRQSLSFGFDQLAQMELTPASACMLMEKSSESIRIYLVRGRLKSRIHKKSHLQWITQVNDYQIAVTGTEFDTEWNEAGSQLTVRVHRGVVRVDFKGETPWSVEVKAKEVLMASMGERQKMKLP